ncbi:hypothetical protein Cgig2_017249 [Carnegiea gigantea]|uniref:ABC1 atypical kinase-like domain-containing protein n=1 Tax=Carnegiea gigantea TaxID=171969 RepID=A0A9Q1GZX5_9CARY|nr:hypothetical protein Cgig2_017249 [Carnegiea gigantea]
MLSDSSALAAHQTEMRVLRHQQGEVGGGDETAKQMVCAWQDPIHNKSGKELQMTMRIQGKEREGENRSLPHTTPSDHHLPLLRRSSSSSSLMLVSPNLGAIRSRGSENSLRNRAKRKKNRVIRAVETSTGPLETSTSNSSSSSSQFEKLNGPSKSLPSARRGVSSGVGDVLKEIKRVRAHMEENEQLAILMRGLTGQNLTDSHFADDNIQLRLVEVEEGSEVLPLVYDPDSISLYWGKRPRAVATRIVQLLSVAGGFLSRIAWDIINKKVKECLIRLGTKRTYCSSCPIFHSELARAIELREIVTSLGPAYIQLGQALSVRPDVLSPATMTELQKLCDKVPSFPDDVAMALIEEELGKPWHQIYSELSPSPIATGGHLVAVKVQRPFAVEAVTVDLYLIRRLGLFLRNKFPQLAAEPSGGAGLTGL